MEEMPKLNQVETGDGDAREQRRQEIIAFATELSGRIESLPFPGIDPEAYARLKATDEEFSGFATPIDELIERFKNEGMKISLGKKPENANVFVLPFGSDDVENDSVFAKDLQINAITDEELKRLILMGSLRNRRYE